MVLYNAHFVPVSLKKYLLSLFTHPLIIRIILFFKVIRLLLGNFLRVPGTDVAGIVVDSCNPNIPVGSYVISTCFPLGSSIDGGFSEYVYIPEDWLIVLPSLEYLKKATMLGTAGFTALLAYRHLTHKTFSDPFDIVISGPNSRFSYFLLHFISPLCNTISLVGNSSSYNTPFAYIL